MNDLVGFANPLHIGRLGSHFQEPDGHIRQEWTLFGNVGPPRVFWFGRLQSQLHSLDVVLDVSDRNRAWAASDRFQRLLVLFRLNAKSSLAKDAFLQPRDHFLAVRFFRKEVNWDLATLCLPHLVKGIFHRINDHRHDETLTGAERNDVVRRVPCPTTPDLVLDCNDRVTFEPEVSMLFCAHVSFRMGQRHDETQQTLHPIIWTNQNKQEMVGFQCETTRTDVDCGGTVRAVAPLGALGDAGARQEQAQSWILNPGHLRKWAGCKGPQHSHVVRPIDHLVRGLGV